MSQQISKECDSYSEAIKDRLISFELNDDRMTSWILMSWKALALHFFGGGKCGGQ